MAVGVAPPSPRSLWMPSKYPTRCMRKYRPARDRAPITGAKWLAQTFDEAIETVLGYLQTIVEHMPRRFRQLDLLPVAPS